MEILTTKRLRLRNFRMDECKSLLSLYNDQEISRYMHWGDVKIEDIEDIIRRSINRSPIDMGSYHYGISFLKSDRLLGEIFLEKRSDVFILGYFIKKESQGHGYAFEILDALIRKLLLDFPEVNIEAIVDKKNEKSRRLLKRLGFHNDIYQIESSPYAIYSLYGSLR